MKAIVNGAFGRMGSIVTSLVEGGARGFSLAACVDKAIPEGTTLPAYESLCNYQGEADVIIDFSNHAAAGELCEYAVKRGLPLVIATTGFTAQELQTIHRAAEKVPVFLTANTSVGIALLAELAKRTAAIMEGADIEIVETHHNQKLDAPSGTALMLADEIKSVLPDSEYVYGRYGHHKREKKEIGIHAVRLGNVVGVHEIIISTGSQTITLKHEAHDRTLLGEGAIAAAQFLVGKPAGFYSMKDMLR